MSETSVNAALPIIAWSRIWSPIVPEELRAEAWDALELPGVYEDYKVDYWSTFHTGSPAPKVPLLLHAALGKDGSSTREDWLRVLSHFELEWKDMHMPPDQLGIACEIYACAIEKEEPFLIEELRKKYLSPWCTYAAGMLVDESPVLTEVVKKFAEDLADV